MITRTKAIISVAAVLALLLSMTGALLLSAPGSSPGGPTTDPLTVDNGPGDAVAGSGITDTASSEERENGCPEEAACPDKEEVSALTTIAACKTATGFWERTTVYDWSVEKTILRTEGVRVSPSGSYASADLATGETMTVQYQIVAERFVESESDVLGVRGYVTVTNTGLWPTDNLRIVDHIQTANGCGFEDVASFEVDTLANPVLCPGESYSYAYEYEFEAAAGVCYRNLAVATVSNMEAACDGVSTCARFSVPCQPEVEEIDEGARLVEMLQCPEGFECVVDDEGPWMLTDSETVIVSVDVTNVDAACGETFALRNAVRLTEQDTCQRHCDSAVVELSYECEADKSTTISVEKSIDSSWARGVSYVWGVEKSVTKSSIVLDRGETDTVTFVIIASRTPGAVSDNVDVFGKINVTNTGANPTSDLAVHDILYVTINGVEHVLADEYLDLGSSSVLAPGESRVIDYSFDVTDELLDLLEVQTLPDSLAGLSFRNVASASITNYEGHEGSAYTVKDEKTHVISGSPEMTTIDEQAVLSDLFGALPEGFEVTNTTVGPWILNDINIGGGRVMAAWKVDITNVDAACGSTFYLTNRATITASDSGASSNDDAMVTIETPECGGITLAVDKTVNYGWNVTTEYDWTVQKTVNDTTLTLAPGATGYLEYTLTVVRVNTSEGTIEVWATVSVTNNGPDATQSLKVTDRLSMYVGGSWVTIYEEDLTAQKASLASGETFVYSYSWDVTQEILDALGVTEIPDDLGTYSFENLGSATVTNYDGYLGEDHGVQDVVGFAMATVSVVEIDETATLSDAPGDIPEGFEVIAYNAGPWSLGTSGIETYVVSYRVTVTNVAAECASTFYLDNIATLVEDDTGAQDEDDAQVVITTPECPCAGCTLTIGYWKNHDGSGPQDDDITPLIALAGGTIWLGTANGADSVAITTAAEAKTNLDRNEDSSNGINRLYAQLTAAKLNILNGACDNAVEDTIAAADVFLATHSAADWDSLTAAEKAQVNGWKDTLDQYNNGLIGPGHCPS